MPEAVREFEREFAGWLGARYAFAFWKGRVALYAILRALGVGEGDEVVVPGYTCVMNVNPIEYLRARAVYVDIEPTTYNIDPGLVEAKLGPGTRIIIAQHTYGFPCDMDAILDIGRRRGVPVLEDCCLALGSRYRERTCGTMGTASYFSFQWSKPFTTGLGGLAVTNDDALAARIREICAAELRSPSVTQSVMLSAERLVYRTCIWPRTTACATRVFRWLTRKGLVVGSSARDEFVPRMSDAFFTGMSEGQARSGLRQLRKVDRNLSHRREMARVYGTLLRESGWDVPAVSPRLDPVLVRYPVRVSDKPRVVAEAPRRHVALGTWFECPLHPIETRMELYGYAPGLCPVAEEAAREVVNLPTYPRAGLATARRSVDFLRMYASPPARGHAPTPVRTRAA